MLSTYTIWDQLWSALVTTLAKIVWTLLKAENRHTSQKKVELCWLSEPGDSAAAALYLLPAILTLPPLFPHGRCAHIFPAIFSGADLSHVTRVSLCHAAPCCHDSGQPGTESCCCRPAQSARPARGHYTQPRQKSNISCDTPTYTVFIN